MIASNHVATLPFYCNDHSTVPQESHNTVSTGQAAVSLLIFCGFALKLGASINEPVMGWLLIVMSVCCCHRIACAAAAGEAPYTSRLNLCSARSETHWV